MRYGRQHSRADAGAALAYKNLRLLGWHVAPVMAADQTAYGVTDAVCSLKGPWNHLLEMKELGGRLEETQVKFHRNWPGCIHIATSSFQADELMRECEKRLASAGRQTVPSA